MIYTQQGFNVFSVPCPALDVNMYGSFNLDSCRLGLTVPGVQCEFHCYDGYIMEGNNVLDCLAGSTWDRTDLPTCHGEYFHYL